MQDNLLSIAAAADQAEHAIAQAELLDAFSQGIHFAGDLDTRDADR
jgi:hypothetical protein